MKYVITDYNKSSALFSQKYESEWKEIERVIRTIPLFVKDSDQRGKQGTKIFNPVGTNRAIEEGLVKSHWKFKMPIPEVFSFLGTDIDFVKKGILVEAQFSNYPFLLNNIQRSELFLKSSTVFDKVPTEVLVIITKCHFACFK
jgi:hypothetical protein